MIRSLRAPAVVVVLLAASVVLSAQKTIARRVFVNVTDKAGAPVAGLTAADFELTEGGAPRAVSRVAFDTPMRILLFVDSSGSITSNIDQFRQGLTAFVEALPIEDEIGVVSFSGQLRLRLAPTPDRQKLRSSIANFAPDGGPSVLVDALFEADKRFLKNAPTLWPVFVIVTTDMGESRVDPRIDEFNAFVKDYGVRGGSAHAVVLKGPRAALVSDLVLNFTQNTAGMFEPIAIANALPDKLKGIAARIAADRKAMASRYEVEYPGDPKVAVPAVQVRLKREDASVQMSFRRPF